MHAWNQIIFGWQFGLWISLTYFFCYKKPVLHHIERLHDGIEKNHWVFIVWGTVLFFLVNLLETLNYLIVVPRIDNEPLWTEGSRILEGVRVSHDELQVGHEG